MKHLILIFLSLLGFSCKQQEESNYNLTIDLIVQTTPLMQPYLCLTFNSEYCDSIRTQREIKLKEWAEEAKSMQNKDAALTYFMLKVSELRNDVSQDYSRALNESLSHR